MGSLLLAVIYLIFISLGLPDSLLGSGWPTMQLAFGVPSSWAGYVSMTIIGLLGFSICRSYWMLFLFAVPYGLGAGAIDAAVGIGIMPLYLLIFALLNIGMLELAYRKLPGSV